MMHRLTLLLLLLGAVIPAPSMATEDPCLEIRNPQALLSNRGFAYLNSLTQNTPINHVQRAIGAPYCRLQNGRIINLPDEDSFFVAERLAYPMSNNPNTWIVLFVRADNGDYVNYEFSRSPLM